MATVSIRYMIDNVDTALELYTKLTQPTSVRYLIDDARAAVGFYTIHLSFAKDLTNGAIGITAERARAIVAGEYEEAMPNVSGQTSESLLGLIAASSNTTLGHS
jgi:hypothetical protein